MPEKEDSEEEEEDSEEEEEDSEEEDTQLLIQKQKNQKNL
jgi:hypothetical protein